MAGAVKYLVDEHIAKSVVVGLRQRGIDVLTVPEADARGAKDIDLLERARAEGRVIVTHDTDFLRLHASGHVHAGIAYSPQSTPIGDMIRRLVLIAQVLDSNAMAGHLEFV